MLSDIAVSVVAGECLALVGRSGSGKTTLGRCLAGLHSLRSGTLLLDGEPLRRSLRARGRAELAAVQYVLQEVADRRETLREHRTAREPEAILLQSAFPAASSVDEVQRRTGMTVRGARLEACERSRRNAAEPVPQSPRQ
nr:ATP-binding cassette domain-containing protein [Streptomyces sp. NBC_00974]